MYWKLLASMLEQQMESSHLSKESLLPDMFMESLPLVFSTTAVWLEWTCILMDTYMLTLLMLFARYMFCRKLVHIQALSKLGAI